MIQIVSKTEAHCPECGYIWSVKSTEVKNKQPNPMEEIKQRIISKVNTVCPACGHGLPDNQRVTGYGEYKGYSYVTYKDGTQKPTNEEIDKMPYKSPLRVRYG